MPTTQEEADTLFGLPPAPQPGAPTAHPAPATLTGARPLPTTLTGVKAPPAGIAAVPDVVWSATPASLPDAASMAFDMPGPEPLEGLPTIRLDNRREQRFKVSWPARVQLPNGRVVEVRVRDLSASGVGLRTPVSIPPSATINFAMGVPGLNDPNNFTPVSGTVLTAWSVLQGPDIHCGGTWVQLPPEGRALIEQWIRKLAR